MIGAGANAAMATLPHPKTPWAAFPSAVHRPLLARRRRDVLRVTPVANAFDLTPLPDATWGLHLVDANIALGNLADLVRHQISLYERR